jgi:hypothetical protein
MLLSLLLLETRDVGAPRHDCSVGRAVTGPWEFCADTIGPRPERRKGAWAPTAHHLDMGARVD